MNYIDGCVAVGGVCSAGAPSGNKSELPEVLSPTTASGLI
jgi:hypothetical protein